MKINGSSQYETREVATPELTRAYYDQRYSNLIDDYRTLFAAARHPNASKHGCEHQLKITTQRNADGQATVEAVIRSIKPSHSQYSVGFMEAAGFEVSWWERDSADQHWHKTWPDTIHFKPDTQKPYNAATWEQEQINALGAWLETTIPRAQAVYDMLMDALQNETLNPGMSNNAQQYIANQPLDTLLQA